MTHIFLYGPSGTGKSTIGQLLADQLRLPFVDLDHVIETKAGMSIPQIMEIKGESTFREMETSALKGLIPPLPMGEGEGVRERVIALGGGALLRDENRQLAEENGKVILLMAGLDTLIARLESDSNKRPLLAGDLREKLPALLAKRGAHYASFMNRIEVDEKTIGQVVHQLQVALGRHHISAMGEYDVIVDSVERVTNLPCSNSIIVTDDNVAKFHLEKIKQAIGAKNFVVVPAGEEHKNLETISHLWKAFLENGLDRKSTVIALGGGVVGDMAGFAASTYMRGINWIAIPTTLLSMVDASIGGKTGFDLPEGKNLIGSFHPPKLVLADPNLLLTLSDRELRSGMAEVVKHGIISDPALFEMCKRGMDWVKENLEEVVKYAMAVKIKVIEQDPYEKGIRATLNLGHTVGHAVELISKFELRHGEAIAIGTVIEAKYAEQIGVAEKGLADKIAGTMSALGLPIDIPDEMPREEIIRAMRVDKKKNAKVIRFALPSEIGKVELVVVRVTDLEEVIGNQ